MTDNVFQAVYNWFRAKNQEAAAALSDPVRDGKLAISDSEKQIEAFSSKIARSLPKRKHSSVRPPRAQLKPPNIRQ